MGEGFRITRGMPHLLALDQGTTATSARLVEIAEGTPRSLKFIAEAEEAFPQYFPQAGWVEHDLEEIWGSVLRVIRSVTRGIHGLDCVGIGITNQRETLGFWERQSLRPVARALVWQDRRSQGVCRRLAERGREAPLRELTGLLLDPYFSATKALWAREHWSEVARHERAGTLQLGTMDTYLLARLTQGQAFFTEPTNASRTLAFDLRRLEFSAELGELLELPAHLWAPVRPSMGIFGYTRGVDAIPDGVPITSMLGDQQAALLGQRVITEGRGKCTFGTGSFLLVHTGSQIPHSASHLLTTIASHYAGCTAYALEGSAFNAGAAVEWAHSIGLVPTIEASEDLARSVTDNCGVSFVPALTGLGAPHWDPEARGLFCGLTRGTKAGHLMRAILEGIAHQNTDIVEAMGQCLGRAVELLQVDGGGAANGFLLETQANLLGIPLHRGVEREATLVGALLAAGLGAGIWRDLAECASAEVSAPPDLRWGGARIFRPDGNAQARAEARAAWTQALRRASLG